MTEENPFKGVPLGYFNALMNVVVGDQEQKKLAKEYLAEVDPLHWK
jgi:hypothetical protein